MDHQLSSVKGTRDFLPEVTARRNYIFSTVEAVFQRYGFLPIATPAMEKTATLMGKYGEEGDRLVFRLLNSGEQLKKADLSAFERQQFTAFAHSLSEKGLRYDLTVPFARFIAQHQHELNFPFKRYQIQPVWRADRPQKGRYREFYQCDVDVVGSNALLYEIELIQIVDEVLTRLGLTDFSIQINHRKLLSGIAEVVGESDNITPITVAIDKLDKIGKEGVVQEFKAHGISDATIEKMEPLFRLSGSNKEKIDQLKGFSATSETALKGIEELTHIVDQCEQLGLQTAKLTVEPTLARGLNYYTGTVFEVISHQVQMGSICGGGRYDELTALFGVKGVSGVGISFGADRIYDVMDALQLFPKAVETVTQVLFVDFGTTEQQELMRCAKALREKSISCEVYPSAAKLKKQLKYAHDRHIPFVVMMGEDELTLGKLTVKNMQTGEQQLMDLPTLIHQLSSDRRSEN